MHSLALCAAVYAGLAACGARTGLGNYTQSSDGSVMTDTPSVRGATAIILHDRCRGDGQIATRFDPDTGATERLFQIDPTGYTAGPNGLVASPDGRRYAWAGYQNIAGSAAWRVYVQDGVAGAPQRLAWGMIAQQDALEDPAWSPDGLRFAFSVMRQGGERTYAIAEARDGAVAAISVNRASHRPAWSRDGVWLASIELVNAALAPVYIESVGGRDRMRVTTAVTPGALAFTSDGQLAVVEDVNGTRVLALRQVPSGMPSAGFLLTDLGAVEVNAIATEPNGTRIVLQARSQLWVLDRVTGRLRSLYNPAGCTLVHNGLSWVLRV